MKRSGMVGVVTSSAALALVAWAGCGGVSGTDDLFTPSGNGGNPGSGAGSTAGTSGTSGHGATTGPSGGPVTSAGGATTSSAGATTTGGSVTSSGAGPSASSAASSTSAASSSSGGPTLPVACNNGVCQPGQICCFNPKGPGDHCGDPGTCTPGYVQLDCSGPQDCPGSTCCATVDTHKQVPYLGSACQPSCDPNNQVVVCSDQQPGVCPQGTQCQPSQSLGAGYSFCWPGGGG